MYNGARDSYITYERLPSPIVISLGDGSSVKSTHHGILLVQHQEIDALHTPTFRYSLLSVGEFDMRGYSTEFGNGKCSIQGPQNTDAMTGSRNGRLYT